MSLSKSLRLTARSCVKCQYVRLDTQSPATEGVSADIVGNDLRMFHNPEREIVKQNAAPQDLDDDDFIIIA